MKEGEASPAEWRPHLDLLRIVSIFLVIVNHTNSRIFLAGGPYETATGDASLLWFASITYFFTCKVAVPLFLFTSGALLLGKRDSPKKWRSRVLRILALLLAGSAIVYVYQGLTQKTPMSFTDFFWKLLRCGVTNSYWYLYVYLGFMLLLPLLQRLVAFLSQKQLAAVVFILLGVLGTLQLAATVTPLRLPFFTGRSVFVTPYVGMVLAGYYLEHYFQPSLKKGLLAGGAFLLLIAFQVFMAVRLYDGSSQACLLLDNRTMSTITGSSVCVYAAVRCCFSGRRFSGRAEKALCQMGKLTLGMYLCSDMVIDALTPCLEPLQRAFSIFPGMLVWELLIFLACAGIAALLRTIPPLRRWI